MPAATERRPSPLRRVPPGLQVVAASGLAGVAVYGFTAVAARVVPPDEYSAVSVFWSLALLIGFGGFQPIESELARTLGHRRDTSAALRDAGRLAALVAVAVAVVLLVLWQPVLRVLGGDPWMLAAAVAVAGVSALQFWTRGALLGRGAPSAFAGTIVVDSGLRLVLALAVALLLVRPGPAVFAFVLVVAIGVGHLVFARRALRGAVDGPPAGVPAGDPAVAPEALGVRALARRISPLFAGSACAQVLLNAGPIVIAALTASGDTTAGAFGNAFLLARIPLFMAVPVQGALVPPMAAMVAAGRTDRLARLLLVVAGVCAAIAVVGGVLAAWLGPWVVALVFTDRYPVPGADLALMVVGVAAHVGLLIAAQANLASGGHLRSAASWATGLAVALLAFAAGPELAPDALGGLIARVEWSFALGSAAGWALAMVLLLRHARREGTRS